MLALLKAYWQANPDLRLGQLVVTATGRATDNQARDPFYVEDDAMYRGLDDLVQGNISALHRFYEKGRS